MQIWQDSYIFHGPAFYGNPISFLRKYFSTKHVYKQKDFTKKQATSVPQTKCFVDTLHLTYEILILHNTNKKENKKH